MTDAQENTAAENTPDPEADITGPNELDLLKERAKQMGITHSPNIGVDALRKKINAALNDEPEEPEVTEETPQAARPMTELERQAAKRKEIHDAQMKLVRVRITNLNPSKADLPGEIFTVRNKYLGIKKKYVPYGEVTEDGYHIPQIIFNQLKARKFLSVKVRTKPGTQEKIIEQNWVPEFALEVLPQLTPQQLKDLAAAQAAGGGV